MTFEWETSLEMTRGSFKTDGALVEAAVDMDVSKFPTLEAGLIVVRVALSKGCVIVTAGLPDFGVSDSDLFFLSQRGQQGGGGGVLRSGGCLLNKCLDGGWLLQALVKVNDEVGHVQLVHDRDELCSEPGLYIIGDMFNGRSDGVPGGEWEVHNNIKAFDLKVGLV